MGIFNRKTMITVEQLAESVVEIPHMPNQMNKVALNFLIKAFQIVDEAERTVLEVEYSGFSFSLWWFRYMSYFQVKHGGKLDSFNKMVGDFIVSFVQKRYPLDDIGSINKFYAARLESYQNAYSTSNYIENIADILLWYIGFGLNKGEPCLYPINVPVTHPIFPDLQCKMTCAAVTADLWKFIDKHMKGWKVV